MFILQQLFFLVSHGAATSAAIDYSNARIARNKVLYGPEGVVESTKEAKDYIQAKFGTRSQQAQQTKPSMISN